MTTTQGLWKGDQPFIPDGMLIGDTTTGGHGVRFNGSSVAIVELILHSLAKEGTPARVLFPFLQACFTSNPKDIGYFRCTFDIHGSERMLPHQKNIKILLRKLNE